MLKFTLDNKLYSSEIIEDTTSIFYFYPDNKIKVGDLVEEKTIMFYPNGTMTCDELIEE